MDYLNFDKIFFVHRLDIQYIRRVRVSESLGMDRDGPVAGADNPDAAVVVLRGRPGMKAKQLVTEMPFAELLDGKMGFVDIGGNRYVPAANIEQIAEGQEIENDEPYTEIWLEGRPHGSLMVSKLSIQELEERRDAVWRREDARERASWSVPMVTQRLLAMAA